MKLKDQLTIIIPCKNEKEILDKTLDLLNYQSDIRGVKVIVCDSSDDGITSPNIHNRLEMKSDTDGFDLYLMRGGLPSFARNNGFKVVTTPYVLFMDADAIVSDFNQNIEQNDPEKKIPSTAANATNLSWNVEFSIQSKAHFAFF